MNACVVDFSYLDKLDLKIATTAMLGRDYNMPRVALSPRQVAMQLKDVDTIKSSVGIIIGREGPGLTNDEVKMCDFTVSIPAFSDYL